ncbi:bola protein [Lophiotrema nucula]|uniref:Bola protein n=1 Tax=Lophiotrema nucula TaxID=690887 RepID=A0A6A5YUC8_9PLEO|nr:bola protein [Lophiotrema nucula]
MFIRRVAVAGNRYLATMSQSMTPLEDTLRLRITETFQPTSLKIYNDSHMHSHHKAMEGVTSKETHFRVEIISEAFKSKPLVARQRMVNALFKDEMSREGGIHALQLKTRTPEEEEARKQKEAAE